METLQAAKPIVEIKKGIRDWISTKPQEKQWLFDNFLHKNSIGILDGMGSSSKSRLLLQMSFCLCARIPFLDFFKCDEPRKVLYLDAEDPGVELHRRVRTILPGLFEHGGKHGLKEDEFLDLVDENFHSISFRDLDISPKFAGRGRHGLEHTELFATLIARCQTIKPELIIIDPLIFFCPAAETENEIALEFYSSLKKLKATVLIVQHQSKSAMNDKGDINQRAKARGASVLTENARTHFSLENNVLICDKNNYVERGKEKWKLDLRFDNGIFKAHGEPNYDAFLPKPKKLGRDR